MVLIDPVVTESDLAERVDYTRAKAGGRADDITFCFPFNQIALDDAPKLDRMRALRPDLADEELESLPTVLTGTIDQATQKIRSQYMARPVYAVLTADSYGIKRMGV